MKKSLLTLIRVTSKGKIFLFISLFCLTALTLIELYFSILLKEIMDAIVEESFQSLLTILFSSVCTVVIFFITYKIYIHYRVRFINVASYELQNHLFRKSLFLDYRKFSSLADSSLDTVFTADQRVIEQSVFSSLYRIYSSLLAAVGSLVIMFATNWMLTLYCILLSSFPLLMSWLNGKKVPGIEKQISEKSASFLAFLHNIYSGFLTITLNSSQFGVNKLFEEKSKEICSTLQEKNQLLMNLGLYGSLHGVLAQLSVFIVGGIICIVNKTMNPGDVLIFVQLLNFLIDPVTNLPQLVSGFAAALHLIDKDLGLVSPSDTKIIQSAGNEGYTRERTKRLCISDPRIAHSTICLSFPEMAHLRGRSGCGKSTFLKDLITHEISLSVDSGKDLAPEDKSDFGSYADLFYLHCQQSWILDLSIEENIRLFRDELKKSPDYELVLNKTGVSQLIASKDSDFTCGISGKKLSEGERQRICIARSLLSKQPVILFDEPTSALDSESEWEILNFIKEFLYGSNRSAILVLHHSTPGIENLFDKIYDFRK